jgi:hypothetical protein
MQKRPELYEISEPEAAAASNVIPIGASPVESSPPRDHTWRDLMRRLQKSPAPRKPRESAER